MSAWAEVCAYRERLSAGHDYGTPHRNGSNPAQDAFRARPGSHDDGPLCGLFLGGIGTPVCGRNLDGQFARWHLQNGYHVNQAIDSAFFAVRWQQSDRSGYFRLAESGPAAYGGSREVLSLFPVMHERYGGDELPFELIVEFFTPLVPGDNRASTLPLWYASITVHNRGDRSLQFDGACFWPNMLGWRTQQMTSVDRPQRSWPSQTHAGNSAAVPAGLQVHEVAVIQQRYPGRPINGDMQGQVLLWSWGPTEQRSSVEACFKAGQNCIERPPQRQGHTIAWAEHHFAACGTLPASGAGWTAHWDEAIGSAVSRGAKLAAGESTRLDFLLVLDLPLVQFGGGRCWRRLYCRQFGSHGQQTVRIARYGAQRRDRYRAAIDRWHADVLNGAGPQSRQVRGAMINELYFINGGGSAWVDGSPDQSALTPDTPRLGAGQHAALLEGYDVGYYYYNTSDLWSYAWYAIWRWWPVFARLVFADLLASVALELPEKQMIYRSENLAARLVRGKVPHDLGSVMDDPWHRINGYQMRDNSNLWKDHNPAFILSLYLKSVVSGETPSAEEWQLVREAGRFALSQAEPAGGLPLHTDFGDSTWDNLGIRGYAAYSGSLTIGCLAALVRWAERFSDAELARQCRQRLAHAQISFVEALWNGTYYRVSDRGTYADCVMGDGILGFFLADLAGLGNLIDGIDRDTLRSHLCAVYRHCFVQYERGRLGPLLLAESGRTRFAGDGGDELQVNEVLLGSAWMTVSMMHYYGLETEADTIAAALVDTIYGTAGLQFRTPAAVDAFGRFRAPMNMRPLSIWFLDAVFNARDPRGRSHNRIPG
ncbi:MAG: hypothetical protein EA384_04005 [Spirochaetaceae bacterium]|nr:MAG: hypothetical protein EA384_04005 [Spirochaetaceae bacterium]